MKSIVVFLLVFLTSGGLMAGKGEDLSIAFFNAVKTGQVELSDKLAKDLAQLKLEDLADELDNDQKKLAFWINIYNTNIQYVLKKNPALFDDRGAFFKSKQITIAGELMSLDKVEHGILRRSKTKWSLGYFGKLFVPKFERMMRVKNVDGRIHYALNCGATSCPPIVPYHSDRIDQELDESVSEYLKKECQITEDKIKVPALFSWFRADFGGKRGVRKFLLNYGVISKADFHKELFFLPYDWTLALDPYKK